MNNKNLNNIESNQTQTETVEKKTKVIEIVTGSSVFKYFLGGMIIFGVCFISCLFAFQIVLTQIEVVGYSMLPTINSDAIGEEGNSRTDYVYYLKKNNYKHKDIVIVDEGKIVDKGQTTEDKIIKRVIATGGDTIEFKKTAYKNTLVYYKVYLNGNLLSENYILDKETHLSTYEVNHPDPDYPFYNNLVKELYLNGSYKLTLKKDQYFVMGDNRNNSTDSRYFGPVKHSEILGKTVLHVEFGETLFNAVIKAIFSRN